MRVSVKPVLPVAVFALIMTFLVLTIPAEAGNFSLTCKNISLQGAILKADCEKKPNRPGESVSYRVATLNLENGIGNNDGVLSWGGTNFRQSCKNISLEGRATLKADCSKNDLVYLPSSLNLNESISNDDAVLKFDSPAKSNLF